MAAGWTLVGGASAVLVLAPGVAAALGADLVYGKFLASECATCHPASSDGGTLPAISGLPTQDFVNALRDYRSGRRSSPVMQNVARSLDDTQIEALAAYFASLKDGGPDS